MPRNHLFLQVLDDERVIHFDIDMGDKIEPAKVIEGAVDRTGRHRLKNIEIVWHDDEWAQMVFKSDEGQHIAEYQIIDLDTI